MFLPLCNSIDPNDQSSYDCADVLSSHAVGEIEVTLQGQCHLEKTVERCSRYIRDLLGQITVAFGANGDDEDRQSALLLCMADENHSHVPGKVDMGLFRHNRPVFDALFPNKPTSQLSALSTVGGK